MRFTNYTFQHNGNQGGMAFVVRVADGKVGVVGPGSGGIGYGDAGQAGVTGLSRSLAVEFDTFKVRACTACVRPTSTSSMC